MSLTPLQQLELEQSRARRRELFIRQTLDDAPEEFVQAVVFMVVDAIVARTELDRQEAAELQRAARMRVMLRWLEEMGFHG